jgi:hypothetical protein
VTTVYADIVGDLFHAGHVAFLQRRGPSEGVATGSEV